MTNHYVSLEKALELAASRLPSDIFTLLVAQAEEAMAAKSDTTVLERKIHDMINEYETGGPVFSLERLKAADEADEETAVA